MKSPSMLEPEFTPEDLALVEGIEAFFERYFGENQNADFVNCSMDADPRFARRHWNEAVRRMRAAGWVVTEKFSTLLIQRPPLGEVETSVRFSLGAGASNLIALVQLVAGTPVEGVLDVYLDDRGLARLVTMHRLGTRFSPGLRLLTSEAGAKRLSADFVKDALVEFGCAAGEVRVTSAGGHEGRFLFLAGCGIVSIGCSLNKLDVNERAFRDGDRGDLADFETRWATARRHA